ncbi:UNVERIFIED_CONTAM: hypothetical protein Sindi_0662000, partial [Sesamum indicum]
MWASKFIQKQFTVARKQLVKPLWLATKSGFSSRHIGPVQTSRTRSAKNKPNQTANPTTSSTMYLGGSSSVGMHKRKM